MSEKPIASDFAQARAFGPLEESLGEDALVRIESFRELIWGARDMKDPDLWNDTIQKFLNMTQEEGCNVNDEIDVLLFAKAEILDDMEGGYPYLKGGLISAGRYDIVRAITTQKTTSPFLLRTKSEEDHVVEQVEKADLLPI